MELLDLVVYLLVGGVAGVLAGLLGVGGGIVIVPVLLWVFRLNQFDESVVAHLAVGTSLGTIIITSISSIRAHQRRAAILWPQVMRLAPGIILGAWLGAVVADLMPTAILQRVFACFAVLVSIQMWLRVNPDAHRTLPGRLGMGGAGAIIGAISAVVGIGGGSLTVPFLSWCGINMRNAVATSAACGLPIAVAGALGFLLAGWNEALLPQGSSGYIFWPALLAIGVVSFLAAPLGARLAHSLPVSSLKRIFAALLLVVGVKLFVG